MNPTISSAFLEREQQADPAHYAREYLAEFTAGLGAVFPDDLIRAAVYDGEPTMGDSFLVSVDASSLTGRDTFACLLGSIRHQDLVVRQVHGWRGSARDPVSHRAVQAEIARIANEHRAPVVIDQWASEPLRQGLAERGCTVRPFAWSNESKEEAVTITRRLLHEGRLHIPKHPALISELVSLEQRMLPSGRPRYAAPGGRHDDFATALLALARSAFGDPWLTVSGPFSSIA